jgi:hypothetical protein
MPIVSPGDIATAIDRPAQDDPIAAVEPGARTDGTGRVERAARWHPSGRRGQMTSNTFAGSQKASDAGSVQRVP